MKVYLDNSATSYPKPQSVENAVMGSFKMGYGNMGRTNSIETHQIEKAAFHLRQHLCTFFNFDHPDHVVFTKNITESINTILWGYLGRKDHVIVTAFEHNAVLRSLEALKSSRQIEVTVIGLDDYGHLDIGKLNDAIKDTTRLIVANHVSNVSGQVFPIEAIGVIAKSRKVPFVVDAAQSAGVLEINMKSAGIDCLCFTGHKGLMGPQGIGGFLIEPDFCTLVSPLIYGGTGSYSDSLDQPDMMPDKFESGTLNSIGIVGLKAGIETLMQIGLDRILEHETRLIRLIYDAFANDSRVKILGDYDQEEHVGVISLQFLTIDNALVAYELSKQFDITVRVGLHCAPLAHKAYGSFPQGTVRFSVSFLNTIDEIKYTIQCIKELLSQM